MVSPCEIKFVIFTSVITAACGTADKTSKLVPMQPAAVEDTTISEPAPLFDSGTPRTESDAMNTASGMIGIFDEQTYYAELVEAEFCEHCLGHRQVWISFSRPGVPLADDCLTIVINRPFEGTHFFGTGAASARIHTTRLLTRSDVYSTGGEIHIETCTPELLRASFHVIFAFGELRGKVATKLKYTAGYD